MFKNKKSINHDSPLLKLLHALLSYYNQDRIFLWVPMQGVVWGPLFSQTTIERYLGQWFPTFFCTTNQFLIKRYFHGPAKKQLKTKCIKNDSSSCLLGWFEGFLASLASP